MYPIECEKCLNLIYCEEDYHDKHGDNCSAQKSFDCEFCEDEGLITNDDGKREFCACYGDAEDNSYSSDLEF